MSTSRSAAPSRPADVHVRINRLIVDRAAVADASGAGLREPLSERIAHHLEHPHRELDSTTERVDLSDTIARAVADHVSSRLDPGRRR